MAKINPDLIERLRQKLNVKKARVYALISETVRRTHLPRHLAAIALAAERGINISKYADAVELSEIRQATRSISTVPPVIVPVRASPAPTRTRSRTRKRSGPPARRRGNSVFVVHGRNQQAAKALFAFLRAVGLQPLEWVKAIKATREPSPFVGTILEAAFGEAVAIVVLLTPDDEARLKPEFVKSGDPAYERRFTGQARPNVLFEAGMAFGRNPGSTVLVQIGSVRPFSDVAGRHVVHLSNDPRARQELATKLANAGCNVDTSGSDWLSEGEFDL